MTLSEFTAFESGAFDGRYAYENLIDAVQNLLHPLETDLISRQDAINALWKALYEYEDKTEKQFIESDELNVADWIEHRIFVQNMSDIDRQTILALPSARPETHEKRTETHACDCISRQAAEEKLKKVVDEMALIFADIREKNVDDSVCGLCEYDCDHGIDGYANECPGFERNDCFKLKEEYQKEWTDLSDIPSVEPERETGKWIDGKCNRCGANAPFWPMATTYYCSEYCPNCGAKMEVDGNVTEF